MSEVVLSDALLSKLGGWDAIKQARSLVAAGRVLESHWAAPKLEGTVQEGNSTVRAGLVIRSATDADNLCPCRTSRQRGLICAHSIAVGLHVLQKQSGVTVSPVEKKITSAPAVAPASPKASLFKRDASGEPVELSVILSPQLAEAVAKEKIMVFLEAGWRGAKVPLSTLPPHLTLALKPEDEALLDTLEKIEGSGASTMMQLDGAKFAALLPVLAGHPRVSLGRSEPVQLAVEVARPKFKLNLAGGLAILEARMECTYSGNGSLWTVDSKIPLRFATRDLPAEQAAFARLISSGFSAPDKDGVFHMKGQDAVLGFFARDFPAMEKDWAVTLEERLERSAQNLERIEVRAEIIGSGEQWFDLHLAFDTKSQRFSTAEIQRLLRSGQSHATLANGKIALIDTGAVEELEQVLVDSSPNQIGGAYRLHNAQAGFLDATLRQHANWDVRASEDWKSRAARQRGEIKLDPPDFGPLETVLRPYQKEGVAWMRFLRESKFGGILADEMGLGKTLQVLAHLSAAKAFPSLVICPTSLVFNWEAEAKKFTPHLRVLALHGSQRHGQFAAIPEYDLIITSYTLFRRDAEHYRGIQFDTVVLDEAQHIKNRQTQNAQAVKSVRAAYKMVLTGTPLENSVLDLWSIFDFLMPGYLGSTQDFRDRYEIPLMRERNAAVQKRLSRRLRPFMLRRLKQDVAADLPPKIEQVSFCELNEDQRALYQQVLEAGRRELANAAGAKGNAQSRMMALTALLRLRQICCDARLLKLEKKEIGASGKTELLLELLEEAIDGGHRVLIFSQFTSMLGILRDELTAQKISTCYLDGSTKDRAAVVEQFQSDSSIPVFLISLKAGGVGLNLTGADTVIHFDPWWNPAVEAQAADRAHRIGQKKVVTSYKLITRGTVEEKILHLQARKRSLAQAMLDDDEQWSQGLTWDEIQQLLEP